jgi:hypothetical protein
LRGCTAPGTEWCQRYALIAMDRPGRYVLEVTNLGYITCKLVRTTP